jgi:hypothetical protein
MDFGKIDCNRRASGRISCPERPARPPDPEEIPMNFEPLIPITLFLCITYSIKAVVDARVRKQMVASNGDPSLVRGILEGEEAARRLSSLRWGITMLALALGFGIVEGRGWEEITPGTIAVLVGALGLGNLAFFAISRKLR